MKRFLIIWMISASVGLLTWLYLDQIEAATIVVHNVRSTTPTTSTTTTTTLPNIIKVLMPFDSLTQATAGSYTNTVANNKWFEQSVSGSRPGWTNDFGDGYLTFAGDDYCKSLTSNVFWNLSKVSIFAWVRNKADESANGNAILAQTDTSGTNTSFTFNMSDSEALSPPYYGSAFTAYSKVGEDMQSWSSEIFDSATPLDSNRWVFVCCTYRGNTASSGAMVTYTNGYIGNSNAISVETGITNIYPAFCKIGLGASDVDGSPSAFWKGDIDYVGLCTGELSRMQVFTLWVNTKHKYGYPAVTLPSSLAVLMPFTSKSEASAGLYTNDISRQRYFVQETSGNRPGWTNTAGNGGYLIFDATDDRIESLTNLTLKGAVRAAIFAWVRCDNLTLGSIQRAIFTQERSGESQYFYFWNGQVSGASPYSGATMAQSAGGGATYSEVLNSKLLFVSNRWALVAWSFHAKQGAVNGSVKVFTNGFLSASNAVISATNFIGTSTAKYGIGARINTANRFWKGGIDYVGMCTGELTTAEFNALWNNTKGWYGL